MKKHIKSLSLLIVIFMILQMLTVGVFASDEVSVAAVNGTGYDSADDVDYQTTTVNGKSIIHNWGAREEDCVFLSDYALAFYRRGVNNLFALGAIGEI